MHALTPYIHLLQNHLSVSLHHYARYVSTPELPCIIHLTLVAEPASSAHSCPVARNVSVCVWKHLKDDMPCLQVKLPSAIFQSIERCLVDTVVIRVSRQVKFLYTEHLSIRWKPYRQVYGIIWVAVPWDVQGVLP